VEPSLTSQLQVVVVPWPGTQDSHAALLGAIHEPITGIRVEPSDVDIVVLAQHGGDVRHAAADAIQGGGRVIGSVVVGDGVPNSVPDEAEICRR